jgi:hypothetical protein
MFTPIVKELPPHLEPITRDTFIDRLGVVAPAHPELASHADARSPHA